MGKTKKHNKHIENLIKRILLKAKTKSSVNYV